MNWVSGDDSAVVYQEFDVSSTVDAFLQTGFTLSVSSKCSSDESTVRDYFAQVTMQHKHDEESEYKVRCNVVSFLQNVNFSFIDYFWRMYGIL